MYSLFAMWGCGLKGIKWKIMEKALGRREAGIEIRFPFGIDVTLREALRKVDESAREGDVRWLRRKGRVWVVDLTMLKELIGEHPAAEDWLNGLALVEPELEAESEAFGRPPLLKKKWLVFTILREEHILNQRKRVFLSHKGADKGLVRQYCDTLKSLGFAPWLDEEAMPAGTEVDRGIHKGMQDSCAVVFFITPHFRDETFLRNEINFALEQRRLKGDRFAIITLIWASKEGDRGEAPEILRQYVWKEPETPLDGLREIVRALPLELGPPDWRDGLV